MGTSPNLITLDCAQTSRSPRVSFAQFDEDMSDSRSPAMIRLVSQIAKVAGVNVPVLLLGESGVGKEFIARRIHEQSRRARRTFLKVNCAAVPTELLESELFGYEAGAFTGATRRKPGQFELCDQGTILLDEIGEMSSVVQAKMLHVLQDLQFCRLGGSRMMTVDVRILAATNVNIHQALAEKKLRADLYYRLNAITFRIPPLRERREVIPMFIEHFLKRLPARLGCEHKFISARALNVCMEYSWPGNVRELKNFLCRYLVLEDENAVIEELLRGRTAVQPREAPRETASAMLARLRTARNASKFKPAAENPEEIGCGTRSAKLS